MKQEFERVKYMLLLTLNKQATHNKCKSKKKFFNHITTYNHFSCLYAQLRSTFSFHVMKKEKEKKNLLLQKFSRVFTSKNFK